MSKQREFLVTVTERGAVTYRRLWPARQWEYARDDYFLALHQNRLGARQHQQDRLEKHGARLLPCSHESAGILVKIERVQP